MPGGADSFSLKNGRTLMLAFYRKASQSKCLNFSFNFFSTMAWLVFASSYLRLNTLNMLNLKNNVTLFIAEISINRFVSRRDGRASLNFCKRGKQTYFTQIHCKYNYIQVSLFCIFRLFLFSVPIFSPQAKVFFRHCHYF